MPPHAPRDRAWGGTLEATRMAGRIDIARFDTLAAAIADQSR